MNSIVAFKNIHNGKRLFILASGSNINDFDLSLLSHRMVMGLNRSFLASPEAYYHCVFDHRLFEKCESELQQTRCLFTLDGRPWGIPLKLFGSKGFS